MLTGWKDLKTGPIRDASDRFASYSNLSPGKYVFMVKASNNSGVWNEEPIRLVIIVKPPFWRTVWFYLLLLILLVSGLVHTSLLERKTSSGAINLAWNRKSDRVRRNCRPVKTISKNSRKCLRKRRGQNTRSDGITTAWQNSLRFSARRKSDLHNLCRHFISSLISYVEAIAGWNIIL